MVAQMRGSLSFFCNVFGALHSTCTMISVTLECSFQEAHRLVRNGLFLVVGMHEIKVICLMPCNYFIVQLRIG